jgi:hypothetical protein
MKLLNTILTTSLFALALNVSASELKLEQAKSVKVIQPNTLSFIMKDELEKSMKETFEVSMKEIEKSNNEYFKVALVKSISMQIKSKTGINLLVNNRITKSKLNAE